MPVGEGVPEALQLFHPLAAFKCLPAQLAQPLLLSTLLTSVLHSSLLGICQPGGQIPLCFALTCEAQELLLQLGGNAIAVAQSS
jgi:hypothetical protein